MMVVMMVIVIMLIMMMMIKMRMKKMGWCRLIYCPGRKELLQNGADLSHGQHQCGAEEDFGHVDHFL